MRAPEPISGLRVVSTAAELDAMTWSDDALVLRLAPDDLFVIEAAVGATAAGAAQPESAIIEEEHGFVGWWLAADELAEVAHHAEWALPEARPALAQGLIAGVPARLWLGTDRTLLLCHRAYAHELIERLA